ncbi:MAG: GIY-YIG nuclease family protein [Bacteroidota bacterium]
MGWKPHTCYVYILSNAGRSVLYIGMTNDIHRRMHEHKESSVEGFAKPYRVSHILWFEAFNDMNDAITREKQLKNWRRDWKWALICETNPELCDLTSELIQP